MTPLSTLTAPAFCDLSSRVKLRVTGADASRFLNGQITNDLRKATEVLAMQGSLLSAKGKLTAHVFIAREGESFLLDADHELQDLLAARLERYIIADDVQIEDVTTRFSLFHLVGEAPFSQEPARTVLADRFGTKGRDVWFENETLNRAALMQELSVAATFVDDDSAEVLRVEQGIPRWGRELTDEIIPVEANLEGSAIDYFKGCYVGQEVISRMKMSGQTNKRLCGLVSLADVPLAAGMRLTASQDESKDVGWITSAVHSPRLAKEIALGYVKRGFNTAGSRLAAVGPAHGSAVEVVALPFI